jgi:hypothetical protein
MNQSKHPHGVLPNLLVLAALTLAQVGSAGGGLENASPEILVSGEDNIELGTTVAFPDVGVDEQGRQIYVWEDFGQPNGIGLRRFDSAGNPLEDPRLIVPEVGNNNPLRPRVAVAADGSFMVIWQSTEDLGGGSMRWIRGLFFDSDGLATGPAQLVSTIATGLGGLSDSDIAALRLADGTSGGFVAVWSSDLENPMGSDTSSSSIQAQRITAAGVPTGNQIEVNTITQSGQRLPSVTEMADGGFFVVWVQPNLQGQRFTAAGAKDGGQFQISTAFSNAKDQPDVAIGWDGTILVVWEDFEDFSDSTEIRARLYDSELNANGNDFRVNTVIANAQELPRVGDYGPKGFLVTWESNQSSAGADTDSGSVQARIITGSNSFDGPQVQYNIWGTGNQEAPASHGWYGRLATDWDSTGNAQDPPPGNTKHVMGRTIEYCMFCDDFEWFDPGSSGSLWRWSSTSGAVP